MLIIMLSLVMCWVFIPYGYAWLCTYYYNVLIINCKILWYVSPYFSYTLLFVVLVLVNDSATHTNTHTHIYIDVILNIDDILMSVHLKDILVILWCPLHLEDILMYWWCPISSEKILMIYDARYIRRIHWGYYDAL